MQPGEAAEVLGTEARDVLVLSDSPDCLVRYRNLVTDAESLFDGALTAEEF